MFQKFEIGRLCFLILFEIERIPTAIFLARKLGSRRNIGQDPLVKTLVVAKMLRAFYIQI